MKAQVQCCIVFESSRGTNVDGQVELSSGKVAGLGDDIVAELENRVWWKIEIGLNWCIGGKHVNM